MELSDFFVPSGVQIPEEDRDGFEGSAVKRHQATAQSKAHGALRRLAPVVKALSPQSQNKRFLATIDRLEGVVGTTAEQGALVDDPDVRRRDKETGKRIRKNSETRIARVQLAIAHRRQHRPTDVTVVPGGALGAEI